MLKRWNIAHIYLRNFELLIGIEVNLTTIYRTFEIIGLLRLYTALKFILTGLLKVIDK